MILDPFTAYVLGVMSGMVLVGLFAWGVWPTEIEDSGAEFERDPHERGGIG